MQMFKSVRTISFAAALLFCVGSTVRADTIVTSDAGTAGTFELVNNGGGIMTLMIDGPSFLTNINGSPVGPFVAGFDAKIVMAVTPTAAHNYDILTSALTKTFFDGAGGNAALRYNITAGQTGSGITEDGAILAGPIKGILTNGFSGFDFSGLTKANTFALSATTYTGGATTMDGVFTTTGATANGSLAFSESSTNHFVTPVPSTLVMAMTALVGFVGLRAFKRPKTIAA